MDKDIIGDLIAYLQEHPTLSPLSDFDPIPDGKIHRYAIAGDHGAEKSGWYSLHADDLACAVIGSWRHRTQETWYPQNNGDQISDKERATLKHRVDSAKKQRAEEECRQAKEAMRKAKQTWGNASPLEDHPYLQKKKVKPYGLRKGPRGEILVPGYSNKNGHLQTLQFISGDGHKQYLQGSQASNIYFRLGDEADPYYIIICEGYATAATIHEATDCTVYMAFQSSNLDKCVGSLRVHYPDARILIAADDDKGNECNPGLNAALQAAEQYSVSYCIPQFSDRIRGTDFNDLAQASGTRSVRTQITDALAKIDDLPVIQLRPGALHKTIEAAEDAILRAGVRMYRRGSMLVRPAKVGSGGARGILRHIDNPVIYPVETPFLQSEFARIAKWMKYLKSEDEWVPTDCPEIIAKAYLAQVGRWRLPTLRAIIEAPTIRGDGTILDTPGYDEQSALLFSPNDYFPRIPQKPSESDVRAAKDTLADAVSTWPFVGPESRAVAVSALLTALARRALPTAPLHAIASPSAGTGKSLLIDLVSIVATGTSAAVVSQASDDEELDKRLHSTLLQGDAIVNIDNCTRPLESDVLCQLLTQESVRARRLGKSETVDCPATATIFATGNNLTISGDVIRRSILCSLDAVVEHPERRHFERDIHAFAYENRAKLVWAALVILRDHFVQGVDEIDLVPMGSFEDWSRIIRGALVRFGWADPAATTDELRASDPDAREKVMLFQSWLQIIGTQKVTTKEIIRAANESSELKGALEHFAERRGEINARALGKFLGNSENQIVGGLRLAKSQVGKHSAKWCISPINSTL